MLPWECLLRHASQTKLTCEQHQLDRWSMTLGLCSGIRPVLRRKEQNIEHRAIMLTQLNQTVVFVYTLYICIFIIIKELCTGLARVGAAVCGPGDQADL